MIVVTGVSSGIGEKVVENLLSRGHEVIGLSRKEPRHHLKEQSKFRFFSCDLTKWGAVSAVAKNGPKSISGLICCAGTQGAIGRASEIDPQAWLKTVEDNLSSTLFTIRAFQNHLTQKSKVICFSGGGATGPRPHFSAYASAKIALVKLVENLSYDFGEIGIDINIIAPGAINTAMTREVVGLGPSIVGEEEFSLAQKVVNGGGASIEKVTQLVEFLLSSESDGISGKLISAQWDSFQALAEKLRSDKDFMTLRRQMT